MSEIKAFEKLTIEQLSGLVEKVGGPSNVPHILSGELGVILTPQHTLACTVPLIPTKFIDPKWSFWRGSLEGDGLTGEIEQDERSLTLEEIDWTKVTFTHCLEGDEKAISGKEKLRRLKQTGRIRFGGNVLLSLWTDYRTNGGNSILEWLYRTKKIIFMDFYGSVLRNPAKTAEPCVLYLHRDDGEWKWSHLGSLLNLPWEANNVSPVFMENSEANPDYS